MQKYPCSLPGFSLVAVQADTRDLPLPTHIFWNLDAYWHTFSCISEPVWVTKLGFITHCWAIAKELGALGLVCQWSLYTQCRFAWEPFKLSLFLLFIYLVPSRVQGQGVPAFWVILLPLGEEADKPSKKMDFIHCGKVSVYRGKKCVPHSLHMMNLRLMWR